MPFCIEGSVAFTIRDDSAGEAKGHLAEDPEPDAEVTFPVGRTDTSGAEYDEELVIFEVIFGSRTDGSNEDGAPPPGAAKDEGLDEGVPLTEFPEDVALSENVG